MGTPRAIDQPHYVERLNLRTVPEVLLEKQSDRDRELAGFLGCSVEEVAGWPIFGADALLIIGDPAAFYEKPITEERLADVYRSYADLHLGRFFKTVMYTAVYGRSDDLFDLLTSVQPGDRVLDFGAGVGTHTLMFLQAGCEVDLLDLDGPARTFAQRRLANRGLSVHAILEHDATLPDGHYDRIICTDVLEHMLYPSQTVRRLAKACKPGGILHVLMSRKQIDQHGHILEAQQDWEQNGGQAFLDHELEPLSRCNFRKPERDT